MAFVMPRSILTGAFQHTRFRYLARPQMKLLKIFDLEDVSSLFNVPACVLICIKGQVRSYSVLARRFNGRLERKTGDGCQKYVPQRLYLRALKIQQAVATIMT